mgnify:CR=1 FL=1
MQSIQEAWDDLEKTVIDYFNRFIERDEEMRKLIGTEIKRQDMDGT